MYFYLKDTGMVFVFHYSERSEVWPRVARVLGPLRSEVYSKISLPSNHPTNHPTKDTLSSAVFPPNFWTNLIFFIDIRLCFLHNFFIYPTIEYFLELVRLCFPQNFWTNQHFFIGFFYLKSRSNMPENKGLPIFSTPSSPPPPSFLPKTKWE